MTSSIHFSSLGRTKKEKEDLRNQARSYLSSCTQYGGTSHEITFLAAYLQFKSNDLIKALGTVASLPDVGVIQWCDCRLAIKCHLEHSLTHSC